MAIDTDLLLERTRLWLDISHGPQYGIHNAAIPARFDLFDIHVRDLLERTAAAVVPVEQRSQVHPLGRLSIDIRSGADLGRCGPSLPTRALGICWILLTGEADLILRRELAFRLAEDEALSADRGSDWGQLLALTIQHALRLGVADDGWNRLLRSASRGGGHCA